MFDCMLMLFLVVGIWESYALVGRGRPARQAVGTETEAQLVNDGLIGQTHLRRCWGVGSGSRMLKSCIFAYRSSSRVKKKTSKV